MIGIGNIEEIGRKFSDAVEEQGRIFTHWERQREEAIRRYRRLPRKVQKRRRSRWHQEERRRRKRVTDLADRWSMLGRLALPLGPPWRSQEGEVS